MIYHSGNDKYYRNYQLGIALVVGIEVPMEDSNGSFARKKLCIFERLNMIILYVYFIFQVDKMGPFSDLRRCRNKETQNLEMLTYL